MGNSIGLPPSSNVANSSTWDNPAFIFGSTVCECSGHGACNSEGICICQDGFVGASDFVNAENVQCHVSLWAIRGLWIFNLVSLNLVLFYCLPKAMVMYNRFLENRARLRKKGRSLSLTSNKGLYTLFVFIFYLYPFTMATGLLIIFDERRLIGIDPVLTVLWAFGRSATYIQVAIHQPALIKRLLRAQNATHEVVDHNAKMQVFICVLACCSALWALPVLITEGMNVELARAMFALYCASQATTFFIVSIVAIQLRTRLRALLTKSYETTKDDSVLILRDMISVSQRTGATQGLIQSSIFIIFLVIPNLWITHRYLLPISWFGPICKLICYVLSKKLTISFFSVMNKGFVDSVYVEKALHSEITKANSKTSNQSNNNFRSFAAPFMENQPEQVASIDLADGKKPARVVEPQTTRVSSFQASTVVEIQNEEAPQLFSTNPQWKVG